MSAWCTECGDKFYPVEHQRVSLDPDEPRFCSDACEEEYTFVGELNDAAYNEARYGAATVF